MLSLVLTVKLLVTTSLEVVVYTSQDSYYFRDRDRSVKSWLSLLEYVSSDSVTVGDNGG